MTNALYEKQKHGKRGSQSPLRPPESLDIVATRILPLETINVCRLARQGQNECFRRPPDSFAPLFPCFLLLAMRLIEQTHWK